ncbi:hypothetical protein B0H15DRAFT_815760 [Mycena belliarum]|uniref:DUF6533 domain-containing protein n=1 Tax=Mycena belliarum TaxID=1033014 RepID=A0AAD6XWN0_9AGAR|nr:hypothetical protein B0H15DRAFT_815760 [Mycena belliae]
MNAVQLQSRLNSNYYFNLVSFTLLFYDYFLTLNWEISRYWASPRTGPKILFYANRYGTLLGNIPVVIQYFWSVEPTAQKIAICRGLESYHQYFIIVTQVMVGVMQILRTFALYERNKRVLMFMCAVAIGAVVTGLWSVITGKTGNTDQNLKLYFGCNYPISKAQGISLASAWAGLAVFDCMIFLLTLYKAFSRRRPIGTGLFTVLLRDGSIYFGVILMSNLSNILTFALGDDFTRGMPTTFTNIISSIMITRLMLNLRDPALTRMVGRPSRSTVVTSGNLVFAPYPRSTAPRTASELDTDAGIGFELSDRNTTGQPGAARERSSRMTVDVSNV